jgi:hypothetical protein
MLDYPWAEFEEHIGDSRKRKLEREDQNLRRAAGPGECRASMDCPYAIIVHRISLRCIVIIWPLLVHPEDSDGVKTEELERV